MRRHIIIALFSIIGGLVLAFAGTQLERGPVASTSAAAPDVGYPDFSYRYSGVIDPTGEKPESKLWYNDGRWWGSLFHTPSGTYHIFWLNIPTHQWIDTGTVLDPRPISKADCLWDSASGKLYVASGGMNTHDDGRLFRYSYSSASKTYSLDAGFPVTIRTGGAETLVIDKDTTGQLWITFTQGNKVYVNRSLTSDAVWGTPFLVPAAGTNTRVSSDDISSLIAFGGKIGVLWSNQNDSTFYFAVHADADADTTWAGAIALRAPNVADDHINLKSLQADPSGQVFAVVKTSINGGSSTSPQVLLLTRKLDGSWSDAMVSSGAENQTRPILLIDTDQRELYVFSADEGGGAVYYKQSGMDNIQFPAGFGTLFISSGTYTSINNPSSTKQNINSTTGIVVLAGDSGKKWYLHNYLDLGATQPTATATPTSSPTATSTPTATPTGSPTTTATATPAGSPTPTPSHAGEPTSTPTATPPQRHDYLPLLER